MEITRFEFKNFRSIKNQSLELDHNCIILVGKNEAGKSNVLKAIASIFEKYKVSSSDQRKRIDNEIIEKADYYVRAYIKLSKADHQIIIDRFFNKFSIKKGDSPELKKELLKVLTTVFTACFLQIDIDSGENHALYYHGSETYQFENLDKCLTSNAFYSQQISEDSEYTIEDEIFDIIRLLYTEEGFNCHYWEHSKEYLLPSVINIKAFCSNPETCLPLKNIFLLCRRTNIKEEFETALSQDGDYINLLDQVSKSVTKEFRKIWKDFKDTSIQLVPYGEEFKIKVVDKAKYDFEDRSDGFKKFISFLLILSTKSRANLMNKKDIILIDEPDQSLYPTSAKYLRDELLKISDKACVIYTTHSPYMIDTECINRHIMVKKEKDITFFFNDYTKSPFSEDELIKNALGTSIFDSLKDRNLVFEGWLDKKLFEKNITLQEMKKLKDRFGLVYLSGISGVETLVQILILADKKFLIISDSDKTSKDKRRDFEQKYPEYKDSWLAYGDVVKDVSTMEDFLSQDYIEKSLKDIEPSFELIPNKSTIDNIKSVIQEKVEIQKFKCKLVNDLKKSDVKNCY